MVIRKDMEDVSLTPEALREEAEARAIAQAQTGGEGASEAAIMSLFSVAKEKGEGVKRRSFLKWGGIGLVGAGLMVGIAYPYRFHIAMGLQMYMADRLFDPTAFIMVPTTGPIKLICHRSEMGQGIRTGIIMLMAEELEVTMDDVEIVQAKGDPKYGSQNTDGSRSIRRFYERLRKAAATTRDLLIQAAAAEWSVNRRDIRAKGGRLYHAKSGRTAPYGDLAIAASKLSLSHTPKLKSPDKFNVIGKPHTGIDVAAFAQGKAKYGIDIQVPGMLYACAVRAPIPNARIKAADVKAARKLRGVQQVVKLEQDKISSIVNDAVCVVATNTWAAMQAKEALKVEWDTSGCVLQNSEAYKSELVKALDSPTANFRKEGDVKAAVKEGVKQVEASYHTPFWVHAPMAPMACVAHVTPKGCEVWAPCQDPMRAKKTVASFLGIDTEKVTFHVTYLGGGFGRKSQPDFILEAVAVAQKVGKPVKMTWTREDEIRHGFYHAQSYQRMRASVDASGYPLSWHHQTVFPTIMTNFLPNSRTPAFWEVGMGATNMPFRIKNVLVEVGDTATPVRVAWLRSVCNVWHCFAVNSFVDELAAAAGADPLAYRYRLLGAPRKVDPKADYPQDTWRLGRVMNRTAQEFGWDKPLPKGHGKGFASHYSFFSYVAVAIEASVKNGVIQVHRAVITIDCGLAVNPDSVKAQMEGSIIFGLSGAIYGKITLKDGAVEQSNFHDYPLLRMPESPKIEVIIINGDPEKPTGVGEPGVPPVAPALAQALFDATGKRFRDMPFIEHV